MYPHERSLVEKYQGRPFAIVGVNSDDDREKLRHIVVKEKITWRSFWDGGSTYGPIAARWDVDAWPTLYLIDHAGIIVREAGMGNESDEPIEKAVQAAEVELKK